MTRFHKSAAVLLSAVMLFSTALCGCNKQKSNESSSAEPTYAPAIPAEPVGDDVAGTTTEGKLGDTLKYNEQISANLTKVIELDSKSGTGGKIMIAEMTVTNNSDKAIDLSTATHFALAADGGEESLNAVVDISAAIFARQYYTALGSELVAFNQSVAVGETVNGYLTFKAPADYKELKLVYAPYKYFNNDKLIFNLTPEDITHYKQSVNAPQE